MDKDETTVEGGIFEDEDLLDFDLDDLESEEESQSEIDDEIIELVDLVEEDREETGADEAVNEFNGLPDDGIVAMEDSVAEGKETVLNEFDGMLGDVQLEETSEDMDMSDVALELDVDVDESVSAEQVEAVGGREQILDSMSEEPDLGEISIELDEPTPSEEVSEIPSSSDEEHIGDEGISADDLQKILEGEAAEEFDLDLPADDGVGTFDELVDAKPVFEEDMTEESVEKALEDGTAHKTAQESPPVNQTGFMAGEDVAAQGPLGLQGEGFTISDQRLEEIVRGAVEEVVTLQLPRILTSVVERVFQESLADAAERWVRESVAGTAERVIRETIDALKAGLDDAGD